MNSTKNCPEAEALIRSSVYWTILTTKFIISCFIVVLIFYLIFKYKRHPVALHKNLEMMLINVLFIYFLWALSSIAVLLRYVVVHLTYQSMCEFLTPIWLNFAIKMPVFLHPLTSPLLHFFIMYDRIRATLFAKRYEQEGIKSGVISLMIVWILTIIYGCYMVLSCLADPVAFGQPLISFSNISKYNVAVLTNINYFILVLVISISLADYFIILKNRKLRRTGASLLSKNFIDYSLGREYQIKENTLTMRLIFPLDFSYTILFTAYLVIGICIRGMKDQFGPINFTAAFEALSCMLQFHVLITILVYLRFIKMSKNQREVNPKIYPKTVNEEADLHFKQIQQQWIKT